MLLEGTIAELIVKLDPKLYRKYIWRNKNHITHVMFKTEEGPIWYTTSKHYYSGGYWPTRWRNGIL